MLQRMGHQVFVLAGEFEGRTADPEHEDLFPMLSFYSPGCSWEQKQAFFDGPASEDELLSHIHEKADEISDEILDWIKRRSLQVIVAENACALPFHLSMGVGIAKAASLTDCRIIAHDHDFAWERKERYHSPYKGIQELLLKTFPLQLPNVCHAVINSKAQQTLQDQYQQPAVVVPNVMDFNQPFGIADEFNSTLRRDLGLDENHVLLFQVTRIVRRKSIETALRLVKALGNPRIHLIITGNPTDDPGGIYAEELRALSRKLRIQSQVVFAHRFFGNQRATTAIGNHQYNLSDAYANATACTFFSTYEGFGNAFVECVLARKPIFVNNYEPVYLPDIGSKGFQAVMLENSEITPAATEEIRQILVNPERAEQIAAHNYELGRRHFSFEVLEVKLDALLKTSQ